MRPSGWCSGARPYFSRALLDVTKGGVFWIVAFGPERCAMRSFALVSMGTPLLNRLVLRPRRAWRAGREKIAETNAGGGMRRPDEVLRRDRRVAVGNREPVAGREDAS